MTMMRCELGHVQHAAMLESRELNGGRLEELNKALGKALEVVDT